MTTRRHPRLAGALSFVIPGLGQLYAGRGKRALPLLVFYGLAEMALLSLMLVIPVQTLNVLIPLTLALGTRGLVARDAAKSTDPELDAVPFSSRWHACLAAGLLVVLAVNPFWALAYRGTVAQAFRIPSGSMSPTLRSGDSLYVARWVYGWRVPFGGPVLFGERQPVRGDVVAYLLPEDPSRTFLHRVIGLPGETVEIREKTVSIDGLPLRERYVRFTAPGSADLLGHPHDRMRDNWGPRVVPEGELLVLGDNRDASRDSRFWGFVPQDAVLGRAALVYWSRDPETGRVRWDRIGRRIE